MLRIRSDHSLIKHLELYFMICSITSTTADMSVLAATLANAGVCPLTGKRVFQTMHVKNALSLMLVGFVRVAQHEKGTVTQTLRPKSRNPFRLCVCVHVWTCVCVHVCLNVCLSV